MDRGKCSAATDGRCLAESPPVANERFANAYVSPNGVDGTLELLQAVRSLEVVLCWRLDRLERMLPGAGSSPQNLVIEQTSGRSSGEAARTPREEELEIKEPSDDQQWKNEQPREQAALTSHKTVMDSLMQTKSEKLRAEAIRAIDPTTPWGRIQLCIFRFGGWLDWVAIPIIIINTLCIGIEIQGNLDGTPMPAFAVLEHFFLAFFIIELGVRIVWNEHDYVKSGWLVLDASCVVVGIVTDWIIAPIFAAIAKENDLPLVGHFDIIKIFRLLRLFRSLRLLEMCHELWALTSGLLSASRTVGSACVLLMMAIYIFSCLLIEMISNIPHAKDTPALEDLVDRRFHGLIRTIVTLWSFTNGDSIAAVYEPLIDADPTFAFVFVLIWGVITVALMNLVTAVIVDTAIERQKANEESKRNAMRKKMKLLGPKIEELFDQLDASGDGAIEVSELSFESVTMPKELESILSSDKLQDLFAFLDLDGSGTVEKSEFIDGIMHLTFQNVPIETTQLLQLLRSQQKLISEMHAKCF